MLLRSVFLKTLRDLRLPIFWTGLGLAVLGAYFMWLYPTFSKLFDLQSLLSKMPPAITALIGGSLIDVSTPTGFLNMELFPLMLPIILGGFAIALGSGATAAEEGGSLDLLLSAPVARWRVLGQKAGAMALSMVVIAIALFVGIELGAAFSSTSVAADRVAAGLVLATLLALAFGGIAMAIGCATGNRGLSIGIVSAILVVTYFVNRLAPLVHALEQVRGLSPFYYYLHGDPLKHGLDWADAAVLAFIAVVGFGIALVTFQRRDLTA